MKRKSIISHRGHGPAEVQTLDWWLVDFYVKHHIFPTPLSQTRESDAESGVSPANEVQPTRPESSNNRPGSFRTRRTCFFPGGRRWEGRWPRPRPQPRPAPERSSGAPRTRGMCCGDGEGGRRGGFLPEGQSVLVHGHHPLLRLLHGNGSEGSERALRCTQGRRLREAKAAVAQAQFGAAAPGGAGATCPERDAGALAGPHPSPALRAPRPAPQALPERGRGRGRARLSTPRLSVFTSHDGGGQVGGQQGCHRLLPHRQTLALAGHGPRAGLFRGEAWGAGPGWPHWVRGWGRGSAPALRAVA